MYIKYQRPQIPLISKNTPSGVEEDAVSDYRPAHLVRVNDWDKVDGTEAKEGYCALSYAWIQSGEIITNDEGEADRFDKGKHEIITDVPTRSSEEPKVRHVIFERLIQQICKDFDIKYIWYDQGCIDQDNREEKQKEIREMHKVYQNAKFTVALIPELQLYGLLDMYLWESQIRGLEGFPFKGSPFERYERDVANSEWSKRLWTLEEAVMSRHLVMVGTNTYFWINGHRDSLNHPVFMSLSNYPDTRILSRRTPEQIKEYTFLLTPSANSILRQAHLRRCTKPHDRAFALANIFAEKLYVDVDYNLLPDAVIQQFYRRLATIDLTMLCFGRPNASYESTVSSGIYGLPSWTGVAGAHIQDFVSFIGLPWDVNGHSIDDNMRMRINCCKYASYDLMSSLLDDDEMGKLYSISGGIQYTHRVDKSPAQDHDGSSDQGPRSRPEIQLSLTEICDTCIILGIPFKWNKKVVFPVVTDEDGICRSIGTCFFPLSYFGEENICLPSFLGIQSGTFIIA